MQRCMDSQTLSKFLAKSHPLSVYGTVRIVSDPDSFIPDPAF